VFHSSPSDASERSDLSNPDYSIEISLLVANVAQKLQPDSSH